MHSTEEWTRPQNKPRVKREVSWPRMWPPTLSGEKCTELSLRGNYILESRMGTLFQRGAEFRKAVNRLRLPNPNSVQSPGHKQSCRQPDLRQLSAGSVVSGHRPGLHAHGSAHGTANPKATARKEPQEHLACPWREKQKQQLLSCVSPASPPQLLCRHTCPETPRACPPALCTARCPAKWSSNHSPNIQSTTYMSNHPDWLVVSFSKAGKNELSIARCYPSPKHSQIICTK